MKTLGELCKPRESVFDQSRRDTVMDLTNLLEGGIGDVTFFEENYVTDSMKSLLREGFRRLSGKSDQAVFLLSHAMGCGKTNNMISLGLLAQNPALRKKVIGDLYEGGDLGKTMVTVSRAEKARPALGKRT